MLHRRDGGFTMVEMLVGMALLLIALSGVLGMLMHSSRLNKSQQMAAEVQSNARTSLSMVVRLLRNAGWDPGNAGIPTVVLDPDLTDDVSQIEIFADLDGDGVTSGPFGMDEQVTIRHVGDRIESRENDNPGEDFKPIAMNITNDADQDGVPEPMFVPDADPPSQIAVQITARSPVRDPVTGLYLVHTIRSVVVLRSAQ